MSERIYAEIDEDFQRRMRNWARARAGLPAAMGVAQSSIYEGPIRYDRNPEARLPILEGEASDTDAMVKRLPPRYGQAVELFWDYEGASLRALSRRCGKRGCNHETFEGWVLKGHELLVPLVAEHTRHWRSIARANAALVAGA